MHPDAQQYLDASLPGHNRWWRYLLGILLIVFAPFFLVIGLVFGVGLIDTAAGQRITRILTVQSAEKSILAFFLLNLSIIGMLVGLWLATRALHGRSFLSVITPATRIDWRRMAFAAGVTFALLAVLSVIEHLIYPGRYRLVFDAARFFPFLIAVLLLTPLQAATEELIFRGYLTQMVGHLTRNPYVVIGVCTLAFAALHAANPEIGKYGWIIMFGYVLMGLMLATIAWREGRLEGAIGVHAANNVFTASIANNEGSVLQTESVFLSIIDPVFSFIGIVVLFVALHLMLFRRRSVA